jgi:hypothetical protein
LVFVTQHLVRSLMKDLAEADLHESVKSISEIPLDYCALESHVFTVRPSPPAEAEVEGLWSLLRSNNFSPVICHMRQSAASKTLAELLSEKFRRSGEDGREKALVVLFDRRLDPVPPLLTQWTYQVGRVFSPSQ